MSEVIKVFATSSTTELALKAYTAIETFLATSKRGKSWTIEYGKAKIDRFSNVNFQVRVETNVRDAHVAIFHTQSPNVHDELFELFLMAQAIRSGKAKTISVIFPYMPYSRSDLRGQSRQSVGAQLVAQFCKNVGITSVLLVEPHDRHVELFFDPIADKVPLAPLIAGHVKREVLPKAPATSWTIVFPDAGAAKRFEDIPIQLGSLDWAVIQKSRTNHHEQPEAKRVIGHVKNQNCILVDDEVLTCETLIRDVNLLVSEGASSVRAFAAHGILAKNGVPDHVLMESLENSPLIELGVCDTVKVDHKFTPARSGRFTIISAADLIGEATARMIIGEPISLLHQYSRYL